MSTYTVTAAFADKEPGDVIDIAKYAETDVAYLLQVGALVATSDVTPTAKRGKKETTKDED